VLIGVDFDNTIACYDHVFPRAAVDRGLVPAGVSHTKHTVREHLRAVGNEPAWTELQGAVYGPLMKEATPFPGVLAFFARCVKAGVSIAIVSHRTRTPFLGPQYDLHAAAKGWLAAVGFHGDTGLSPERVFFETTKADKLARIAAIGCTHFIDDLPEILGDSAFPSGVERILFDPNAAHAAFVGKRVAAWAELETLLLPGAEA
jgi:hypothetical protein